jgi:hypothetical protein
MENGLYGMDMSVESRSSIATPDAGTEFRRASEKEQTSTNVD